MSEDDDHREDKGERAPPRRARPISREWLFRAAAHYLGRYAASQEGLRRVLALKVERRAAENRRVADAVEGPPPEQCATMVEETVARFVELRLLDDRGFAEARLASLRRRGTSIRQAVAKLSQKGVDRETIASVVSADEGCDRDAAVRYAERRRLGPFRPRDRALRRDRDIAAMMRAGFGYGDALVAIDGEGVRGDPDERA